MSKTFTAIFKLTDQVSRVMDRISESGSRAVDQWENAGRLTGEVFDGMVSSATTTARSLNDLSGDISNFQNSIDGAENATDSFTDTLDEYNRGAQQAGDQIDEMTQASRESEDALESQARAADEAADQIEDYARETEQAGEESDKFGDKSTIAIQDLSTLLMGAGIVEGLKEVGQAFLDASEAAGEFEVATAKIATIADTSQASMSTIAGGLKELSLDTGEYVGDLSEATYQAISASVDTASAVSFTGSATKLAVGGFTQAATAVDVLTTAINAYGLSANESERISDMLVTTQNLGKTSVDQLAQSVGKVIPLAAAYNVEMDNLSAAYAELTKGGIATAEAGTYLKAMLNELGDSSKEVSGILLEQTGYSFAQLMEQGYSLGDVLAILGESVDGDSTKFNELWGSTEAGIGALALYNAGAAQFNTTLDAMQNSAGATAKAYATMTDTTAHAHQEMTNSAKLLQNAVGEDLNPVMEKLYDSGTRAFAWATSLVEDHPAITAALTAITIGVGAFAVGVTAFALVTCPTVVTAINTVTAAMMANPIFLIITGVVALTAAVVAFVAVLSSQESEYESWTNSTKAQYDELQELNAEYEEACEKYGETSEEASRLRYEMDELNGEFEANKQTVEEFVAECDALVDSHNKLMDDYNQTTESLKNEELGTLALIQKLEDLATQNEETAGSHEQMEAIIASLNEQLPDLALSYDQVTSSTEATIEAIRQAAEAQAEQERQAEQREAYVELLKEQAAMEDQIAEAEANLAAERERHGMYYNEYIGGYQNNWYAEDSLYASWTTDLDEYKGALDELNTAYAENQAAIEAIEADFAEVAAATDEAAEQTVSYEDAVTAAFSGVEEEVAALVEEYNKAYEAARSSIDSTVGLFNDMSMSGLENNVRGSFGVFDELKVKAENSAGKLVEIMEGQTKQLTEYAENLQAAESYGLNSDLLETLSDGSTESMANLATIVSHIEALGGTSEAAKGYVDELNGAFEGSQAAQDYFTQAQTSADDLLESLQSQNDFITSYVENIQRASEIGLNEDLVASLSDGSEESAAQLQAVIDKVDELGGTTDEAKAFIDEMNASFEGVESAKDTFANTVAEMETDFTEKMNSIESEMEDTISNLNMADDAAAAATETIKAYTEAILAQKGSAVDAALQVSSAVSTALSSSSFTPSAPTLTLPGHAEGTTDAENAFIAGEDGPELILDKAGSTVFPADETAKILNALQNPLFVAPPESSDAGPVPETGGSGGGDKRITLEIAGSGSITTNGGGSKEQILEVLVNNIKPVLMSIIQTEIYEEGELSYDF